MWVGILVSDAYSHSLGRKLGAEGLLGARLVYLREDGLNQQLRWTAIGHEKPARLIHPVSPFHVFFERSISVIVTIKLTVQEHCLLSQVNALIITWHHERPSRLVSHLPLTTIETTSQGGLRIGAVQCRRLSMHWAHSLFRG